MFEDRQASYERQLKAQERLIANGQVLCDILDDEMPDLKEKETYDSAGVNGIGLVKTSEYLKGQADGAGIWEDEEERRFYENLIDLQDRVPGILLEDGKRKKLEEDQVAIARFWLLMPMRSKTRWTKFKLERPKISLQLLQIRPLVRRSTLF